MKIDFAGVPVCSGVGIDSPKGYSYEGEATEQVSKFLRAVSAVVRNRLNEYSVISFTLFRPQSSIQAAEKFVNSHRQTSYLPMYGTLVLTSDDGSHNSTSVLYMPNALRKKNKAHYDGQNAWIDFTFTGGALQTSKP